MDAEHKILIVDDEAAVRDMLTWALVSRGFTCHAAENGVRALARLQEEEHAVVVTDIRMPGIDGIELLKRVKDLYPLTEVIIITGVFELRSGVQAMRSGAYDYVTKPFTIEDVVLAIERALYKRDLELQNRHYRENLEQEVELRTLDLLESNQHVQQLFLAMLKTLANTLEAKDKYTQGHSERVAAHAVAVGASLQLTEQDLSRLELAGLLHDIGKIGVSEEVLHKPGRLTPEEYEHIKTHCRLGERILRPVDQFAPIIEAIVHHHERVDGTGYPDGLTGDELSVGAKILAICDAYDAMTSERPYRSPFPPEHACEEVRRWSGKQFDPFVADAFLQVVASKATAVVGPEAGTVAASEAAAADVGAPTLSGTAPPPSPEPAPEQPSSATVS